MKSVLRAIAVLAIFCGTLYGSHRYGVPSKLPGAALNWRLLFHVERAAALLGAIGVVLLIGWRATKGEFPIKFGQVEYAQQAAEAAGEVSAAQEERLRVLEVLSGIRGPADR
jgi:hypothetical protein